MGSSNTGGGPASKEDDDLDGGAADDSQSDGSDSPDPGAAAFSEGEKVLAYHGPRIYEAKVQKSEIREGEWKFFVHYLGWNKNWDEWVGTKRLLKVTEENVRKQRELEKSLISDKNVKSGRSAQNKPKNSTDAKADKEVNHGKGKKRKSQSQPSTEEKERGPPVKLLVLQFPQSLKKQLVDDSEFVTQLGKLVELPRTPNVDEILKSYLEYRTQKDGMIAESVAEILKGLRLYFDKALPTLLLYNKERQQFRELLKDSTSPSTIYGAEHLLRLFVKLPELLAYVNMEEEALTKLQHKLLDFLKFLQKNQSTFFLSSYDSSKSAIEGDSR